MFREKRKLKSIVDFYFSFLSLKKMKLEHRFSFFIFQLSEKMNDPNIHAFEEQMNFSQQSPEMFKIASDIFIHAFLFFFRSFS